VIVSAAAEFRLDAVPAALREGHPLSFPPLPRRESLGFCAVASATHAANLMRETRERWRGRGATATAVGGDSGLPGLHQSTQTMRPWDAISNDSLAIQDLLRRNGFRSEIFAEHIDPSLRGSIRSIDLFSDLARPEDNVLVHGCVHSPRLMRMLEDRRHR
jgi:hypothetical protein